MDERTETNVKWEEGEVKRPVVSLTACYVDIEVITTVEPVRLWGFTTLDNYNHIKL